MAKQKSKNSGKVFTPRKRINRKTKINLVFDQDARTEFLSGFHKRKLQRKKKAKEELDVKLKEEKRRLKQEARESYKKLVVSHRAIPELEEFEAKEYELERHSVSILELSTADIENQNNWIGTNKVQYEADKIEDEGDDNEETSEVVPGMELKTAQDLKRVLKKKATKQVQKSKAFQLKGKIEQRKNKKKSFELKKQRIKMYSQSKKRKIKKKSQ